MTRNFTIVAALVVVTASLAGGVRTRTSHRREPAPWPAATHVDVASRPGSVPGVFILTFTHDIFQRNGGTTSTQRLIDVCRLTDSAANTTVMATIHARAARTRPAVGPPRTSARTAFTVAVTGWWSA